MVYCGASLSARCPHGFCVFSECVSQCLHRVCTVSHSVRIRLCTVSHDAGKTIVPVCSCGVERCSSVVLEGFRRSSNIETLKFGASCQNLDMKPQQRMCFERGILEDLSLDSELRAQLVEDLYLSLAANDLTAAIVLHLWLSCFF